MRLKKREELRMPIPLIMDQIGPRLLTYLNTAHRFLYSPTCVTAITALDRSSGYVMA